jgi:hypothetical protein
MGMTMTSFQDLIQGRKGNWDLDPVWGRMWKVESFLFLGRFDSVSANSFACRFVHVWGWSITPAYQGNAGRL